MQQFAYIQFSIVAFTILLETLFSIRNDFQENRIKDTMANISIAVVNGVINIFVRGVTFLVLIEAQKMSFFNLGHSLLTWVILFLVSDLIHYGVHYLEHKSRFFWALHVIHHSSAHYNFSTAIRTLHTSAVYKFFYELPLCLAGFDPCMVIITHNIILMFGFFQHTELVKKMGWLEHILNTPSHHRVHHASNEKYIDKNFGGVLIIWDKLFGTFQREEEKPVYGLTKPINTYNPLKIVFREWIIMIKDVRKAGSWRTALSYIFLQPGWRQEATPSKMPPRLKKTSCKKCNQCSDKCLARFANMKIKMELSLS